MASAAAETAGAARAKARRRRRACARQEEQRTWPRCAERACLAAIAARDLRHRRGSVPARRRLRAAGLPRALHRLRAGDLVGYMVVWNVTPALHTPLDERHQRDLLDHRYRRVAADLAAIGASGRPDIWIPIIAIVGLTLTTINMFGGFAVTRRMLAMFQK